MIQSFLVTPFKSSSLWREDSLSRECQFRRFEVVLLRSPLPFSSNRVFQVKFRLFSGRLLRVG